ncbi:uncharacterized protein LOC143290727 [Babylonia areolata]|uniref:uncharacterized protein LOC143290727 n=1 Tax=Babylonia areolata TaxID=304850 RepID=UPI003FD619CE
MPRRTSFAEVSRAVTKKVGVKPEFRKRSSSLNVPKLKRRDTLKNLKNTDSPRLNDVVEEPKPSDEDPQPNETEPLQEPEVVDNTVSLAEDPDTARDSVGVEEAEHDAHHTELGEEAITEGGEEHEVEEEEGEEKHGDEAEEEGEEKKTEGGRRVGRFKRLSKKQLRLQQERLEEEQEREERRRRREERRRKKELQAQLALEQATQSFDETAFKESIYAMVKSSLDLVMNQGQLNITVDNLKPLMKGLQLDTSDEDVKELVMDALMDSYGLIEPSKIDGLLLRKKLEHELHELEECVDAAFAVIDQDRDGLITHNDVYRLMIHLGEVLWDNQVADMMQAADVDGDGRISKKDLFLFLLGQEKTVKLEDQILTKYANKDTKEAEPKAAEQPEKEPTAKRQEEEKEEEEEQTKTPTPTPNPNPNSLASTLKPEPQDSQASDRRRKMFAGYARLVVSTKRVADSESESAETELKEDGLDEKKKGEVSKDKTTEAGHVTGNKEDSEAAITKLDVSTVSGEEDEKKHDEKNQPEKQTGSTEQDQEKKTPLPQVNLAASDWSDSGHVGSDTEDMYAEDSDSEEQECAPLALEAGICYLPAPEFDAVGSPGSLLSPRSTTSSSQCGSPTARAASQEPQSEQDANTTPTTFLDPADLDPERADAINSACPARTSEYDSEREGDGDSLPETSHQNLILQEIEQQVLQTQEALEAKETRPGWGPTEGQVRCHDHQRPGRRV